METTILLPLGALIVGVLITLVVCYFLPKEKIRTTNQAIEKQEQEAQLRIKDLEKQYLEKEKDLKENLNLIFVDLSDRNKQLEEQNRSFERSIQEQENSWLQTRNNTNIELKNLEIEVRGLEERRDNIIQTLEKEAKESGEIFKNQQIQIAEEQIEKAKTELTAEYETAKENARQVYLETLADMVSDITQQYGIKEKELEDVVLKLAEAQEKAAAAIEVNRRNELDRQQKDFYKLQLSPEDLDEIKRLREVEPFLRNKEPLNKVIYKCYYEKPYTDLVGRVIGNKKKMGIYKITNLLNGMCYVGQSTDIAERWRQHIKRGVGADTPTQNKLYPAMLAIGVENFMFEIIEECTAANLTPREKYWTDFYQAQSYGYTVKKG